MSLTINQVFEKNPNLLIENNLPDESPLQMTIMTVKTQIGGSLLILDLFLQTVTTMDTNLVILETVRDQLLLIGTLQMVHLLLHIKETKNQV